MTKVFRLSGKTKKAIPCTYQVGYTRQDLYACWKCTQSGVPSGFCAACRDSCHGDHPEAVFELYTKRNFRCDCGNHRTPNDCLLEPSKDDQNIENERCYSHNFEGRYCRCDQEYDERFPMAQCAMCEDWFHEKCYATDSVTRGGVEEPFTTEYELVCKDCVKKLPILMEYYEWFHAWSGVAEVRSWRKRCGGNDSGDDCIRPGSAHMSTTPGSLDLLWRPGFRIYLCKCHACKQAYRDADASYIVDRSDFVSPVGGEALQIVSRGVPEPVHREDVNDAEEVGNIIRAKKSVRESRRNMNEENEVKVPDVTDISSRFDGGTLTSIRLRIFCFLSEHVTLNNGDVDRAKVLDYLFTLKNGLLRDFRRQLDSTYGPVP